MKPERIKDEEVFKNQREAQRVEVNIPIRLSFGTQIVLAGQLKDISLKSAFVKVKSSICMAPNDELNFAIECTTDNPDGRVRGSARISRVIPGEGIAIYFIKMDESSTNRLQQLIGAA